MEVLVPERLRTLIADVLNVEAECVTPQFDRDACESWDSFAHLQLILSVEGEYGLQLDPQRIPTLLSVQSIMDELTACGVKEF